MKLRAIIFYKLKEFLKELLKLFKNQKMCEKFSIFVERPRLLIWLAISFLIYISYVIPVVYPAGAFLGFLLFLVFVAIYACVLSFFLSNVVERFIRYVEGIRHLATQREKERLKPLFYDVYSTVCKQYPSISRNIKIYIIDTIEINACVVGHNTLAVTRGALKSMTDEEIKGMIAHEFGHLINGDGVITILLKFCTSAFLWAFILISAAFLLIKNIFEHKFLNDFFNFLHWLFMLSVNLVVLFFSILIGGSSRKREYRADAVACELGYSQELKGALYKLYNMELTSEKGLIKHLQRTHPFTAYRIEQIEENY